MHITLATRIRHKSWRKLLKNERRRWKRKKAACCRDEEREKELVLLMSNPAYVAQIREEELLTEEYLKCQEEEDQKRRMEWMAQDHTLHLMWVKNEERKRAIDKEQKEKEENMRREWELKLKKEEDEKRKKLEAQGTKLQEATCHLGEPNATHNPEPPPGYLRPDLQPKAEPCPFFVKTGACRFGFRCSRAHEYPLRSGTILLSNMYTHFGLQASFSDDYDTDISLEYSESENYHHFRDFYFDVLPEFERCGKIIQFKVCCNKSPHLSGNVYVQYEEIKAAEMATGLFNGRWYAGRQISCVFVPVERWKSAICGLFWSNKCPKGNSCNFLHVYRNPGNAFSQADNDYYLSNYNTSTQKRHHSERNFEKSGKKFKERSQSPSHRSTSGRRSHSREEVERKSSSHDKHRLRDRNRSADRDRCQRKGSYDRSADRDRSQRKDSYDRDGSCRRQSYSERDRSRRRKSFTERDVSTHRKGSADRNSSSTASSGDQDRSGGKSITDKYESSHRKCSTDRSRKRKKESVDTIR